MSSSSGRPTGARPGVRDRERRRRIRRRRLVLLGAVALVALAVGAGVRALAGSKGSPSPRPAAAAKSGSARQTPSARPSASSGSAVSASRSSTIITVGWVGDTTPGSMYGTPPDGGRALFGSLRPLLSKPDLMIANLEGTYSTAGPDKCSGAAAGTCFSFQAPPSYAAALAWSGIDLVNMANNHSMDYLTRGFLQTQAALKKAGVAYAGPPDKVTIVKVRGLRVAVMGFSPYPWSAPLNDIPAAARLVRRAAAEANIVIVLMHAGAEGADEIHTPHGSESAYGEDRGNVRAFSHAMIDAGADLVLGSGPHVIRGIERYRGHLIAYSLGNFAGWHNFSLGGNLSLSGLLTVRINGAGRILGGRWLSLYVSQPGVPGVDGSDTSAHLVSSLSADDFAHTYRLDSRGNFTGQ
jgi:Bacterial capsule synthesis protein PGA_cap